MAKVNPTNKAFVAAIKKLATMLDKPADEISRTEFMANKDDLPEGKTYLTEWEIRKAGGFTNLRKLYFIKEENLEIIQGSKLVNKHINKIKKEHGEALFFERELAAAVREHLKEYPIKLHPPVKLSKKKTKPGRTIVAAISDTHFGSNISKGELHGLNEYNWTVASRRLALYMHQVVSYKMNRRDESDLVIQLNGDIIGGQIHNQEWFVDLLTTQFAGSLNILAQAISYAALNFKKVTVVCTPGNHGRNVGKADKGRATTHKWDSYENMLYISLRELLTAKHKNIVFDIPESPFAVYKVQGHYVMQTHGDTVINVGNPGKSLNMGSISNQINRVNNSELIGLADKIAIVSVGHVHVPTVQLLENGCSLIINGCLSGIDPFAQSIGIFSNNPTQVIFEATEEHAVGDIRMIQVKSADKDSKYDLIIAPYKGKM